MQRAVLKDASLNAICYDFCYNITEEQRKALPIKYRRMLLSQTMTKTFCAKSSFDEKIMFLHHLGIKFGITFFPESASNHLNLKKILQNYEEEKKAAAQSTQVKMGVYVSTDKEIAFMMAMMGMTISNETYIKALDYNKIGFSIKNWDKKLNAIEQIKTEDVYENANLVVDTVFNSLLLNSVSKELFNATPLQICILLYLFTKRHTFVTRETIFDRFIETTTKAIFSRHFKKIMLTNLVRKHADWSRGEFTISTAGIKLVNDYISQVFKANKFL
jgi:hypothetical protein